MDTTSFDTVPAPFTVVIAGTPSDSHTWNLVYLELIVREQGYRVVNLGPCLPAGELVEHCLAEVPDAVVISSVNGHGHRDGLRVIQAIRARPELAGVPVVIGGKLAVDNRIDSGHIAELTRNGFAAVFDGDAGDSTADFLALLGTFAVAHAGAG